MNEVIKNICERRSVRSFKDEMIPKEVIEEIIKAGSYAPSGRGLQPSIVIAVTNKEMRDRLSKLNASIMNMNSDPFYGAPIVLIVLSKKDIPTRVYDGSCVMENLMLAASSFGVSSCWIHRAKEMFELEEGKKILKDLGIEEEYEGIGNCILGYANGDIPKAKDRKEKFVYYID